jgi:acetyl-CoA/propionyl-CoA carboxylase biotin carboxyl carrier protein
MTSKIKKVLVANRGEIAIRLFRACKELDISSVAVYSDIDKDALHVSFADEAYRIGEAAPSASYLNIGNILDAAKKSGAGAVHPGYGFLAENAEFAQAVEDAGLIWIGPPSKAIEIMGDKVSARRTAAEAGVPSVPGTLEPISGTSEIGKFASEHGWPVALKAAHGGGGRGFRVVSSAEESQQAFEGAAREAESAFGNPELYLERYLEAPRHIEVQVIGDLDGNLIHLGERDCSLQRRHQKLIEESPSPAIDEALREEMGAAAVKVAKAAGYYSAGTIEFLFESTDAGPRFWFLEMNTRLQVEHPVTEFVTGFDLAKMMIRVAEGEPLPIKQGDVTLRGHAIECRINAENPAKNFLPAPGTIASYREPSGPGVRVDSGCQMGSEIPQAYDSLIGKLICYGSDRAEAIARTERALDEFVIEGVKTTIPFHRLVAGSEWFGRGDFHTKTVETDLDLKELPTKPSAIAGGQAIAPTGAGRVITVELEGKRFDVQLTEKLDPATQRQKPKPPESSGRSKHGGSGENIVAPMQGTIIKTLVNVGDKVNPGDGIAVLEAMKMENLIQCHRAGVVKELKVEAGQLLETGALIASIAPEGDQ